MKEEIKIKEEPVNVRVMNEPLEERDDCRVKEEFDEEEGKDKSNDVEMKEEIDIKDEPVNVPLKKEPLKEMEDWRFKKEFDEKEGSDTNKDIEIEEEIDGSTENESEEDEVKAYISESDFEDSKIEYPYVNNIRNGIDMVTRMGTFSCGGILKKAKMKLSVKGVGEIKLPLSYRQGEVLKSKSCIVAPSGKESESLVCQYCHNLDENVAWEVDAKDVTLDKEFKKLIKRKVAEIKTTLMGKSFAENQQVESELYKLVYYEKGGHFSGQCDLEKAPRMFATVVIQLPAGHEGGEIEVTHKGETKVFDFEDESRDNFFFTAFFADCEYELRKIIGGHRLVLIYNLICKNSDSNFHHNNDDNTKPSSIHQSFMSMMNNSVKEWESETKGPQYLVLNLDHKYSDTNILFQHLKGKDKTIADALCSCEDIKVYIATITKNEYRFGDEDDPDIELSYKIYSWMGVKNKKPYFGKRKLHKIEMLLKEEEMFPEEEERCGSEYECADDADDGQMDVYYTYKKRALVFFPKSHEILMLCDSNLSLVLVRCKELSESKMDDALELLKRILFYINKKQAKAMSQLQQSDNVANIFGIMMLFEGKITSQVETFLLSLLKPYKNRYLHEGVGLPNLNSAVALANLINKFSWAALRISVLQLVEECAVYQTENYVELVKSLLSLSLYEPAIRVVEVAASKIMGQSVDVSIEGRDFQTFIRISEDIGWKNLSLKSVTLLWPLVLFADNFNFDVSLPNHFVQAVIEHEQSCDFLKVLLKLPNVVKAKDNPSVQLIVKKHLEQLDVPYPVFSWAMPNACGIGNNKTVGLSLEHFLRSDEETKTFVGLFENTKIARNFGEKYFGNRKSYQCKNYSARYELSGRGKKIGCKVIKTKDYFDEQIKQYNLMLEESKILKEKFSESKIALSRKRAREQDI